MEQFRISEQLLNGSLPFRVSQNRDLSLKLFPVVISTLHNGFYTLKAVGFVVFFVIVKPLESLVVTKSFSRKKKFSPS